MDEFKEMFKKSEITNEEFEAVRDWFSAEKDSLDIDLKEGFRKLISNYEKELFLKDS